MKKGIRNSILIISVLFSIQLFGQVPDSLRLNSTAEESVVASDSTYSLPLNAPQKALIYSAIMPGLGQAYNQKFWKMPIVYGGFIGLGYMVAYYNERHTIFKNELFTLLDDPTFVPPSGGTEAQLRTLVDNARRERDYMIVLTGLFYVIQIADAHIDAHLREFDLNPDLQVKLKPSFEPIMGSNMSIGFGIKFRIE